ncbi:murein hydrolase activator EnvC family protein [Ilumatobacter sp.]|uniref:murein hydrolase activator EnvC family protein n=1 Tax=Ilumatobacter sp. TaxID=1967498 RepID=UPI003B530258
MSRLVPSRRLAVAVLSASSLAASAPPVSAAPCWSPPVVGSVVEPFEEPPCPYCAGNRAVDFRVAHGSAVRAVAAGTVTWTGRVVGTLYVVVQHPGGLRTTYGRLGSVSVRAGDRVLARTRLGSATERASLSLRSGATYLDPMPRIGHLVGRRRLVPIDATPARPAPPPRLSCGARVGPRPGGVPRQR